jgi:NTP pyrophosphatase (non-canonical NTP hydrolase)
MTIDLNRYQDFVAAVTSEPSNNLQALIARLQALVVAEPRFNPSLLLTATVGMASEGGEMAEIVKKVVWQGKPWNDDVKFHLQRELGDVIWYWVNACRALNIDPNEVIAENVRKLENRYPGGSFGVHYSENRESGDL